MHKTSSLAWHASHSSQSAAIKYFLLTTHKVAWHRGLSPNFLLSQQEDTRLSDMHESDICLTKDPSNVHKNTRNTKAAKVVMCC